jgi:transposase
MTLSNADIEAAGMAGHIVPPVRRRVFSVDYKLAILEEYYRLTEPGAKGALLRREGLYSTHIVDWRRARDAGTLAGVSDTPRQNPDTSPTTSSAKKPSATPSPNKPAEKSAAAVARDNERLARENERLAAELARTKAALEIVGKAHALLEMLSESADTDPPSTK